MSTGPNECSYCGEDHGSNEPCRMLDGAAAVDAVTTVAEPKPELWACYWRTRHGDHGITLHTSERDALTSNDELINVSDMTEDEADAFWSLADTDLEAFSTEFYARLEPTGHEVVIEQVTLPAGTPAADTQPDAAVATLAERLIEDATVGTFEDSNTGQAAARAAADLLTGWGSYDTPYQQAHAHEYQPNDVGEVIEQLRAWLGKNCPAPTA